eukprot:TRINITY_DN739_c0_g3_i1.p1 TRINITY_DN739_c0_g3~~TRINITY_DN739_c0_g3_i1.p1  ORF type:complete len:307 (-),score=25.71 TRINITY_DN739_c0_g3_i1:79-999(-)
MIAKLALSFTLVAVRQLVVSYRAPPAWSDVFMFSRGRDVRPVDDGPLCSNKHIIQQLRDRIRKMPVWGTGLEDEQGMEWLSPDWCVGLMNRLIQHTHMNRQNIWNVGTNGGKNNTAIKPAFPFALGRLLTNADSVSEESKFIGKKSIRFNLSPVARAWRDTVRKALKEPIQVYHGTNADNVEFLAKSGLESAIRHHYGGGIYSTKSYQVSSRYAKDWTLRCELYGGASPYRIGILNAIPKKMPVDSYYQTDGALIASLMQQYIITYETSLMFPMEAIEKHKVSLVDLAPTDLDFLKCRNGAEPPSC